jgi:cell division protein FtsW
MAQRLRFDWTLFLTTLALAFFGLVMIYSASLAKTQVLQKESWYFTLRQFAVLAVGLAAMMTLRRIDYRIFRHPFWAFGPMSLTLVLLAIAYFADPAQHRWIRVPGFQLQPSELAKPVLAVFLAYFVSRRMPAINSRHTMLPVAAALAMLAALVMLGDLGTMVVLMVTAGSVLFVAGMNWRNTSYACLALAVLGVVGIAAQPYRLARLFRTVDPDKKILTAIDKNGWIEGQMQNTMASRDPKYQARQSVIAIGSGGVFGLGLMQGRQKMLYIPEVYTDFIYAVVGEELGLWGCTGVLFGYLIILWRGLRLYWIAPDDFGRHLALGLTVGLVFQAMVNMSIVLDLGPTKGIPLPLISYGGTSLLSTLISLGLLLSISERSG